MKTLIEKKLERILLEMLKENTGLSYLDSGSAYGRNYERNQNLSLKKLNKKESVSFYFDKENYSYSYTISLYHFLKTQLCVDSICLKFNKINVASKNWASEKVRGLSSEGERYLHDISTFFDEDSSFNSYNGDSNLSQVIQGCYVTINDSKYLLLQIHGGCDVRGGYTTARLFKLIDDDSYLKEDVYGFVTRKDGEVIRISNNYDGYYLTDENGRRVVFFSTDFVQLSLLNKIKR